MIWEMSFFSLVYFVGRSTNGYLPYAHTGCAAHRNKLGGRWFILLAETDLESVYIVCTYQIETVSMRKNEYWRSPNVIFFIKAPTFSSILHGNKYEIWILKVDEGFSCIKASILFQYLHGNKYERLQNRRESCANKHRLFLNIFSCQYYSSIP